MNYGLMLTNAVEDKLLEVERHEEWTQTEEAQEYERCLREVLEENPRAWADGNIRVGDYILLIDSDTRVPEDCLLDCVSEMEMSHEVGIMQFSSGVMQVVGDFFENVSGGSQSQSSERWTADSSARVSPSSRTSSILPSNTPSPTVTSLRSSATTPFCDGLRSSKSALSTAWITMKSFGLRLTSRKTLRCRSSCNVKALLFVWPPGLARVSKRVSRSPYTMSLLVGRSMPMAATSCCSTPSGHGYGKGKSTVDGHHAN